VGRPPDAIGLSRLLSCCRITLLLSPRFAPAENIHPLVNSGDHYVGGANVSDSVRYFVYGLAVTTKSIALQSFKKTLVAF